MSTLEWVAVAFVELVAVALTVARVLAVAVAVAPARAFCLGGLVGGRRRGGCAGSERRGSGGGGGSGGGQRPDDWDGQCEARHQDDPEANDARMSGAFGLGGKDETEFGPGVGWRSVQGILIFDRGGGLWNGERRELIARVTVPGFGPR